MKMTELSLNKYYEIIQDIKIIRVRFEFQDAWILYPVLFASPTQIGILIGEIEINRISEFDKNQILAKVEWGGYEYVCVCEVADVLHKGNAILILNMMQAFKSRNLRSTLRMNTNIKCTTQTTQGEVAIGTIHNVSVGGMMISNSTNLQLMTDLSCSFESPFLEPFEAKAKVLRKARVVETDEYCYGVRFINLSKKERTLLMNLVKEREATEDLCNNALVDRTFYNYGAISSKIIILSYDFGEAKFLQNIFNVIGTRNYFLVSNFESCRMAVVEDQAKIVFVDGMSTGIQTTGAIVNILIEEFDDLKIVVLLPIEVSDKESLIFKESSNIIKLYYPLMDGELEEALLRLI